MSLPIVYIHGFGSSGRSAKAAVLRAHCAEVYAPSLSYIPELALDSLNQFLDALDRPALLVGSSLGGYYAMHLATRRQIPAVLVNPVVDFDLPLGHLIGLNRSYVDGSQFEFTLEHLQSLRALGAHRPDSSRLLVMVQMGDELLNHHKTLSMLDGAEVEAEEGGDHSYVGFERRIERIVDFGRRQMARS